VRPPRLVFDSRKRFCPQGHDTHRTGREKVSRTCYECRMAHKRQKARKRAPALRPFYPPGLDFDFYRKCSGCGRRKLIHEGGYKCGQCLENPPEPPKDERRTNLVA
jgi:hypothetical protein